MSFSSNILLSISENDIYTSSELPRNSLSSKKDDLINKSRSTFDISSEDKNSNRTSSKFPKNLFFTLDVSPIKKRSKISIQIEESKNKENIEQVFSDEDYDDYLSDFEEYNIDDENKLNYEFNQIKKFNIYFHFSFNKKRKYLIRICQESFNVNNTSIYDLIEYIVHKINNANICIKYNNIEYSVSLKDIDETDEKEKLEFYKNNYEIKPYNFLTKNNCNNYCSISSLKSIGDENITLISKNELNIMIMKKF